MRTTSIFISSLALPIAIAYAQDTPTAPQAAPPPAPFLAPAPSNEPETSLEELLRRARDNNPRLRIAQENVVAATGRAQAARAPFNPTLQLVPGLTGTTNARDEEIILAQPLDLFGLRRARSQVLGADVRRTEAQNRLAVRALEIEVKNAAAQLFAAQEAEKLEGVQVEIAALFRDAASRRAELGDVPAVQVQRARLELLRAQNALNTASTARLTRRAALNQLIGSPPNAPLRVALPLDAGATSLLTLPPTGTPSTGTPAIGAIVPPPTAPTVPTTSATAGGALVAPDAGAGAALARPDLLSAQANLEARQAQVKAIGRELLPSVELQARRSSFFGRDGSYALRAVVTLPLFDFGAIKGQKRAAQADVRAGQASVQLLQQQATAQREIARVGLENRRRSVARYQEEMLPLALDLLRKTQVGYAQGASTYLEVLEAQRAVRQLQTEYLQALVGVQTDENALDAAQNGGLQQPDSVQLLMSGGDAR